MRPSTLAVLIGALVAGFAQANETQLARGAELLTPFKHDLQAALKAGLAKGPVNAVEACQLHAPSIAKAQSSDGIRVGRASHRLRNPDNAPPGWVKPILDAYVTNAWDRTPRAVSLPNGQTGYVEPILLQAPCLTCHGDKLAPEVTSRINALYPEDSATGFRVGDFRGVFWIEFPATQ